jgi:adenylate kinase family enzyme
MTPPIPFPPTLTTRSIFVELCLSRLAAPDCIASGWVLDGYPHTAAQAAALAAAGVQPDKACVA